MRDDQRQQTAGTSGTESEGSHNAYPLPSEIGEKEREAEAQQEEQQQSSGADSSQQEQQQQSEERSEEQQQQSSGGGEDEQPKKKEGDEDEGNKKQGTKPGATRENPDSIPTAGGERLGEKHWGESKVVPDVPKKQDQEGQEGQPDRTFNHIHPMAPSTNFNAEQTRDNTAANTGDASSGDSGEGGGDESGEKPKEGMVDKIKVSKRCMQAVDPFET